MLLLSKKGHAGDPYLRWYTLKTPRYRVHYPAGLEVQAQRTSRLVEQLDQRLTAWLGAADHEPTEIVLTDASDSANGFASILPYSSLTLFVTAPNEMSLLGEYDDWLSTLVAHEQTHIVHEDNVSGLPSLVRTVLGKVTAPNHLLPRWLIEGLAVLSESEVSGGGRLNSTRVDMYLRADALEGRIPTLDQISGLPLRWPQATTWYLYGGKFVEFVKDLYGPGVFGVLATETGNDVIPFAVGRAFRRATGQSLDELYAAFVESLERQAQAELGAVLARGRHEGKRLTYHGGWTSHPRFAMNDGPGQHLSSSTLAYTRDDGHEPAGIYLLDRASPSESSRLLTRSYGTVVAPTPEGGWLFDSVAPSRRLYDFSDLFALLPSADQELGAGETRVRLTVGRRALAPDVSPDGRFVALVTNRAGTTTLRLAGRRPDGTLYPSEILVPGGFNEQVFTPRFSPDGRWLAYAVWTSGGYRDLRLLELASRRSYQPWKDRAVDQHPCWSRDGRYLYFSSDRSGISNIYAWDTAEGRLWQVTNVVTGAFMPEVAPDGRKLVYVGYTSQGFDLFALPLDPTTWLVPQASTRKLDDRIPLEDRRAIRPEPYSPFASMRPRAVNLDFQSGDSGQRLVVSGTGSDAVGLASATLSGVFEPEGTSPDVYLDVGYHRLPFLFATSLYRTSEPYRKYQYGTISPVVTETRTGATTRLVFPFPGEFSRESLSLGYHVSWHDAALPTGTAADPYGTIPQRPTRGLFGALRVGYFYSNAQSQLSSVGAERGMAVEWTVERADPRLGSEFKGTSIYGRWTGYLPLPWLRHHTLAVATTLAASEGRAGAYYRLGGYQDSELLRSILSGIGQTRLSLRGYPADAFVGPRLVLGQLEYRWPLLSVDRGLSTLPLFLRRIQGSLGMDLGGTYVNWDPDRPIEGLHLGVAGELWFDLFIGYRQTTRLGFGYAAGKGEGAIEGGTGYLLVVTAL